MVTKNENEDKISVSGWAILPTTGVPADFVILTKADQTGSNEIITGLINTVKRPDVVKSHNNPRLLLSGFEETMDTPFNESDRLSMFAVDLENKRVYKQMAFPWV